MPTSKHSSSPVRALAPLFECDSDTPPGELRSISVAKVRALLRRAFPEAREWKSGTFWVGKRRKHHLSESTGFKLIQFEGQALTVRFHRETVGRYDDEHAAMIAKYAQYLKSVGVATFFNRRRDLVVAGCYPDLVKKADATHRRKKKDT